MKLLEEATKKAPVAVRIPDAIRAPIPASDPIPAPSRVPQPVGTRFPAYNPSPSKVPSRGLAKHRARAERRASNKARASIKASANRFPVLNNTANTSKEVGSRLAREFDGLTEGQRISAGSVFGRPPTGPHNTPSGLAGAETWSSAIAETALANSVRQRQNTGSGRSTEQREAVKEAERIVGKPTYGGRKSGKAVKAAKVAAIIAGVAAGVTILRGSGGGGGKAGYPAPKWRPSARISGLQFEF